MLSESEIVFQHTAARRRLDRQNHFCRLSFLFQHPAARRRLVENSFAILLLRCFNTQPPEGGWLATLKNNARAREFQHTAARRRLAKPLTSVCSSKPFQHTAARRRLAPYTLKRG